MGAIKTLFIILGLFSFHLGISQEKTFVQQKSTKVIGNDNEGYKSVSVKRNISLQAIQIDPAKTVEEKTKTAIFLDTIASERVNNNRKKVNLTARPIESEVPEVQRSTQTNGKRPETRNENRVELKATLVPSED